ncbi:uncharacterized protein BCR38DRAFT_421698 [Pseudomassariella vexata]|uniref:Mid2 domain-containing protein n=1 Tax=Pseudomassariella vexata TaxID=1141098 RepID=A0A1Y2EFE8_9PEZI|nr:uncharacterized protein BCR38DRAFT_421698 [Pseudomassariella vexata]ORY70290.1 hypothetical protein BCR38DRAFT_421698 [Pseudomassariella vexata]
MESRLASFCLWATLLQSVHITLTAATCYFPNTEETLENYPCNPDVDDSPCCGGGLGNVCLSNGLCLSGDGHLIRGACTNTDWNGCPNICLSASTGGTDLISCSNVTSTDNSYCCDHTNGCCDSAVGRFNVLPSNPTTSASWNVASTRYVVVSQASSTTSSSSTNTRSAASQTATSSTTSTDIEPTETSSVSSSELSTGAKVGIGVGVGVGALMFGILVYILWRLGQTDKLVRGGQQPPDGPASQESKEMVTGNNTDYFQPYQEAPAELSPQAVRRELSAWTPPQELQAHNLHAELPAHRETRAT